MATLAKVFITLRVFAYMAGAMIEGACVRAFRPSDADAWLGRKFQAWARYLLRLQRIDLTVRGEKNLALVDWTRPVFVISNHESYDDIPALVLAVRHKLGFLTKYELGRLPILGYWLRKTGSLMVKRGKAASARETSEAIRNLGHAPNLVIFPEGTRSKNGALGTFMSGAFRMAVDHKGILLPLILRGTRAGWENREDFRRRHAVSCDILEPFDCAALQGEKGPISHRELLAAVHARMAQR